LQLRIAARPATWAAGSEKGSPDKRKFEMRIFEAAAAGVVAVATQILIVATVLI